MKNFLFSEFQELNLRFLSDKSTRVTHSGSELRVAHRSVNAARAAPIKGAFTGSSCRSEQHTELVFSVWWKHGMNYSTVQKSWVSSICLWLAETNSPSLLWHVNNNRPLPAVNTGLWFHTERALNKWNVHSAHQKHQTLFKTKKQTFWNVRPHPFIQVKF